MGRRHVLTISLTRREAQDIATLATIYGVTSTELVRDLIGAVVAISEDRAALRYLRHVLTDRALDRARRASAK